MHEEIRSVKKPFFTPRAYWTVVITVFVLFSDQLTKWLIKTYMPGVGAVKEIIPGFFNLVYRLNPGGAFSMFHSVENAPFIFAAVALLALFFIGWLLHHHGAKFPLIVLIALGCIAGGAGGNLIDRFIPPHHVVDFLDVYVKSYHWPAFNVADSAVCIGAALLIISSFTHPNALNFKTEEQSKNE